MPTPAALFASLIFSIIGLVAFRHGKKNTLLAPTILGIALMAYTYFVDGIWLVYGIGLALCAALYYLWE